MRGVQMQLRSQAAMEYLTTYGWAIIIIAIALAALYQLGVFGSLAQGARARAGACQVYRPYGAHSTDFIALQGSCGPGQLPLYVAQFNSKNSYIISKSSLSSMGNATILWWTYISSVPASGQGMGPSACQIYIPSTSGSTFTTTWDPCTCTGYSSCSSHATLYPPTRSWVMVAYTINGNTIASYAYSSKQKLTGADLLPTTSYSIPSAKFYIGSYAGNPIYEHLNGTVANVQLYNATLSSGQISALYNEGMGGTPLSDGLRALVAWWPLNGDTKDYSGNSNDATAVNVTYSSGYTYP